MLQIEPFQVISIEPFGPALVAAQNRSLRQLISTGSMFRTLLVVGISASEAPFQRSSCMWPVRTRLQYAPVKAGAVERPDVRQPADRCALEGMPSSSPDNGLAGGPCRLGRRDRRRHAGATGTEVNPGQGGDEDDDEHSGDDERDHDGPRADLGARCDAGFRAEATRTETAAGE
jgi:hypothetical protein